MAKKEGEERKQVVAADISREMRESYLDYAMSVIVARALPDVRDGLKPVHRRILYAMHELGLTATAKFRKSATVVGEVLGKYHPHGDSAVYDSLVRLAQPFAMRYPLVSGQGNFGSIDGDSAAAMRYTETKMAPIAAEMLRDIEKETVPFTQNYDATRTEPSVFPAVLPQLLLNGTVGIAVGMATKIPPHNLRELMDALIYLADNPEATTEDLLEFVKGPDFPLGGLVYGDAGMREAYATGRGGVVTRGHADIVEGEGRGESHEIIISSLPYQVNKAELIVTMADLVHEKKIEGIKDIRDESTKDIRIVVVLKSGANPHKVLNALYKHTDLETTFHFNMLALVDGVPRLLSLQGILAEFITHRREVIRKRATFDLKKAEAREHILFGLSKALDHIEEIIALIKKSADTAAAHRGLMERYQFSELQANAILEMKLARLAGLERKKIEDELAQTQKEIAALQALLKSEHKITALMKREFEDLRERYADPRRSVVVPHGVAEITDEDLVPERESVLTVTAGGYVKRTDPAEYKTQRRGGVGVVDLSTKEEDVVTQMLTTSTHSDLLFFTNKGKAYQIKMYELPEAKRATRGKAIVNYLALAGDERVTSVLAFPKEQKREKLSLLMVTRRGIVKKVNAGSFTEVRRSGLIAITLKNDELLAAFLVRPSDTMLLVSKKGQAIRFAESDVREMGRSAAGVRGMLLRAGDEVISASAVPHAEARAGLLTLTENGYGKRSLLKEYKVQRRGGSGIKTAQLSAKTGALVAARAVLSDEGSLVAISKHGQVIKITLAEVPTLGRQTLGVRIMKMRSGDAIASAALL